MILGVLIMASRPASRGPDLDGVRGCVPLARGLSGMGVVL